MKKSIKTSKSKGSHRKKKVTKNVKKKAKKKAKKILKKKAPKKPVKKIVAHKPIKKTEPVKPVPPKKEIAKGISFKIGEHAVYPAHGVGKIEAVEVKTIMGEKMEFLVINIIDTGMNVLLPVNNINSVGLRQVIKPGRVREVYDVLKEKKRSVIGATWNRRYREYMEKIKSGSVFEIAVVLRDLVVLKKEKDLSFGERKMMDTAKTLLIKELALAKGTAEKKVEAEMQKIFAEL